MYTIILLVTLCPRLIGRPILLTPVNNVLVLHIIYRNLHIHRKGEDHHGVSRTSLYALWQAQCGRDVFLISYSIRWNNTFFCRSFSTTFEER